MHVTKDKVVSLSYTLRDHAGKLFEHSGLSATLTYPERPRTVSQNRQALESRAVGDSVSAMLTPDEGIDAHDPTPTFNRRDRERPARVPPNRCATGSGNAKDEAIAFAVARIADSKLTLDANPALARQTVHFDVIIKDIRNATPQEARADQLVPPSDSAPQ